MSKLLKKIVRKLKSEFVKVIPFNISYKPKGAYETIKEYVSSYSKNPPQVKLVYPSYLSQISLEEEVYALSVRKLNKEVNFPPARVVEIANGRLYTDNIGTIAVIAETNKLIGELSLQLGKNKVTDNAIFEQKYFTKPKNLKGIVFHSLIGGAGSNNYFHWLFDSLPKIHLLKKSGWFEKVDYFIVPSNKRDYQKNTLHLLGIEESKIIEEDTHNHIQADKLIASTYVRHQSHIPSWTCDFLRSLVANVIATKSYADHFIYISREDAAFRHILNEDEVRSKLEEFGFKTFTLSSLSFYDQVSLFGSAKVIISPHGAGLANLVFCQKGTSVVELFARDCVEPVYNDLATKAALDYHYLICEPDVPATTARQIIRQNMTVDMAQLKIKLEQVMEKFALKNHYS